jgi:hypothetical protein
VIKELFAKRTEIKFNLILQYSFPGKESGRVLKLLFWATGFSLSCTENSFVEGKLILILFRVLIYNFLYLIFSKADYYF